MGKRPHSTPFFKERITVMALSITPSSHILFIGDSITDCGRSVNPDSLGNGYVAKVAGRLKQLYPKLRITNRGISGNTSVDLVARWKKDCLDLKPSVVSILIGINDTWRRYDQGSAIDITAFEENYRSILDRTVAGLKRVSLILCEPFLLPFTDEQKLWHFDLDPKRRLVRGLADEYGAVFVPLQEAFQKTAATRSAADLAEDGVHPTKAGHILIAETWLKAVGGETEWAWTGNSSFFLEM
ncbi:MAG: SGNH/GDSL hydrolase family protein [Chitinispirillaceae bacterium]|nr:SGNH/GDSL hydrolase family protein [Chitinispirillaceae bacterium]